MGNVDNIDAITGLPQRDSFLRRLDDQIFVARQHRQPLGMLGVDVDHLAHVNYAYSPAAGDAALGTVATILRSEFRVDELLCRFSGNEFYVLLPNTGLHEVLAIAERVRQAAVTVDLADPQPYAPRRCLTFSIGVAVYPDDGSDTTSLLKAVAEGIVQVKRNGRNGIWHVRLEEKSKPSML